MRNLFNMDNPVFRVLGRLADLMILNLVFIACCIPVVTIGAALTGLNYVTLKMAENEEGYIVRSFFKSFKENFRQATIIWLIALAVGALLGVDLMILRNSEGAFASFLTIFITATVFVYLAVLLYVFPVLSRFVNTIKTTIRNSLIMAIADFPRTIVMLLIPAAAVIVTMLNGYTLVYGILIWIMAGFSLISYATSLFMKKVLAKYMPKEEEEGAQDPDHWILEEKDDAAANPVSKES